MGKTVKMSGPYYSLFYDGTDRYYHFVITLPPIAGKGWSLFGMAIIFTLTTIRWKILKLKWSAYSEAMRNLFTPNIIRLLTIFPF